MTARRVHSPGSTQHLLSRVHCQMLLTCHRSLWALIRLRASDNASFALPSFWYTAARESRAKKSSPSRTACTRVSLGIQIKLRHKTRADLREVLNSIFKLLGFKATNSLVKCQLAFAHHSGSTIPNEKHSKGRSELQSHALTVLIK